MVQSVLAVDESLEKSLLFAIQQDKLAQQRFEGPFDRHNISFGADIFDHPLSRKSKCVRFNLEDTDVVLGILYPFAFVADWDDREKNVASEVKRNWY